MSARQAGRQCTVPRPQQAARPAVFGRASKSHLKCAQKSSRPRCVALSLSFLCLRSVQNGILLGIVIAAVVRHLKPRFLPNLATAFRVLRGPRATNVWSGNLEQHKGVREQRRPVVKGCTLAQLIYIYPQGAYLPR
ncbi:hypothetical protein LX32DRAFT_138532 [Colletotrichum zoysiae]|uniref:Uncharacterized protein n=1 Tax=Colletotrichum zoysiae TaxID=1216348 RepID=A0AAD9HPH1_9PEZI|nr:hypothetical protein LX32DRAFT_138532 [Colletotrichum zoysiae]